MTKRAEVSAALRERLLQGEWQPGDCLPTTQELADHFGTSVYTVHQAVVPLVADGLLERRRNLGTVVRHNPRAFTGAGIYVSGGLWDQWELAFYGELVRQLQRQLEDGGTCTMLFADMRPHTDRGEPLPELVDAVASGCVQGLLVGMSDADSSAWLRRLPVAASFFSSDLSLAPVGFDAAMMMRLAFGRLREQDCRRVGMISAVPLVTDPRHPYFPFHEAFTSTLSDLRLKTRDEWVITPSRHVPSQDRYGYESFRRLWAGAKRPDGLFVYPDTTARGVMTAVLELGVHVPAELRLLFHRNTGVDWACPLPADWVVSDTAACAAAMIGQVRRRQAGETAEHVYLPYTLELH